MFRVVFICTGNQARSVIAERYLGRATEALPVTVESGGTMDMPPQPALPEAVGAAQKLGIDLGSHRSRCLVGIDFSDADLVIGFEQHHVAGAVVDGGAAVDKTFLMAELVRLLKNVRPSPALDLEGHAREVIRTAHGLRSASGRFVPGEELSDPAGRSEGFFDETARSIAKMCDELADRLFRPRPGSLGASSTQAEPPVGGISW